MNYYSISLILLHKWYINCIGFKVKSYTFTLKMQKALLLFITFLMTCYFLEAQVPPRDTSKKITILPPVTIDGDTLPEQQIKEVEVFGRPKFDTKRKARRYSRLVRNVKKVYPYVKYIKIKLEEIDENLQTINNDKVVDISIDKQSIIYYDETKIESVELKQKLSLLDKTTSINVRVDKNVDFGQFVEILDIFKQLELDKFSIITQQESSLSQ